MGAKQRKNLNILGLALDNKLVVTLLLAILLAFVVPMLIWHFFPIWWGMSEASTGNILLYYGALLAACGTVFGVYLSVNKAQENYSDDVRNRFLPYLALTHLHIRANYSFTYNTADGDLGDKLEEIVNKDEKKTDEKKKNYYKEFRLKNFYVLLTKKGIEYKQELTNKQNERIRNLGNQWERTANGGWALTTVGYISLPYIIDSVGNGAAIDLRVSLSRKGTLDAPAATIYTLKTGKSIYLHIFSEEVGLEGGDAILGEYELELRYKDILCNAYSQKYPIKFEKRNGKIVTNIIDTAKQILL